MIVGVGTGRSGTLTLALLLDGCQNIRCVHESEPLLPWEIDGRAYKDKLAEIKAEPGRAEVGFYWLNYLRPLLKDVPDVRIVATRRDPVKTAESFAAYMGPKRNHWLDHKGVGWELDPLFDDCYPTYEIRDRHQAIVRYCTEYNAEVDRLRRKYPSQVLVVKTEDLGTIATQQKIFEHCGIPKSDRCYVAGIHHNKRKETRDQQDELDLTALSTTGDSQRIPLYVGTYRKRKHIETCLRSIDANVKGYDEIIFLDDSGDRLHTKWLLQYGQVVALPKVGHSVAMRALCAHANGRQLAWIEEDFEITGSMDLTEMSEHLYHRPYLAQIALLRQPLWADEKRLGGVLEAVAANGWAVRYVLGLWESRGWFTCNPSLWRGHVTELGWPNPKRVAGRDYSSEWIKSKELRELFMGEKLPSDWMAPISEKEPRGYSFGFLDGIRCHHWGHREGHGY